MSNSIIQTPLGFGGTSITLDPLGFSATTAAAAPPAPPAIKKIYWNGTSVPTLSVTDGSGTVKTVLQVYYGSTLVWS